MFTLVATAMTIALLAGLALGLAWPREHPGIDRERLPDHLADGPIGRIIDHGRWIR
ncbi:hypothetical protein MYK68_14120 [Gordonia sp. PP30]|uniref:hypothetical protein n=1 Tax=Gordonia sp. PP30 TaxID=2935861 RepID=UPI001FFE45C2|nr:hypothetical protein [Gordonia sp. PP30]UQE73867.1 hypothetical protein MYK68_14120 [Gordonia sp. PP30]